MFCRRRSRVIYGECEPPVRSKAPRAQRFLRHYPSELECTLLREMKSVDFSPAPICYRFDFLLAHCYAWTKRESWR